MSDLRQLVEELVASVAQRPSKHLTYRNGSPRINAEPINLLHHDEREENFGAEVYLRGPDGERGGALFAAVKDDDALTLALDRMALDTIARAIQDGDLPELDRLDLRVLSVNLSKPMVLSSMLEAVVNGKRFDLTRTVFELPERLMEEKQVARVLKLQRERRSAQFALDDIYSANYNHYPIMRSLEELHYVKIDWRFFRETLKSSYGRRMIRTAITGLLNKGQRVVVEGVSSDRHKSFLANLLQPGQSLLIQGMDLRFVSQGPDGRAAAAAAAAVSRNGGGARGLVLPGGSPNGNGDGDGTRAAR